MKNIRLLMVVVLVAFGASLTLSSTSFSGEGKGSTVQAASAVQTAAWAKAKKGFFESIAESIKAFIDSIASVPSKIKMAMKGIGAEDQQEMQKISNVENITASLDESEFPQSQGQKPDLADKPKAEFGDAEKDNAAAKAQTTEGQEMDPDGLLQPQPIKDGTANKDYFRLNDVTRSEDFSQTTVVSRDAPDDIGTQPVKRVVAGHSFPAVSQPEGDAVVVAAPREGAASFQGQRDAADNEPLSPVFRSQSSIRPDAAGQTLSAGALRGRTVTEETSTLAIRTRAQVIATPGSVPARILAPATTGEEPGLCDDGFAANDSFQISSSEGLDNFISVTGKYLLVKNLDGGLNAASICSGHVTRCPASLDPCVSGLRNIVNAADACKICVASRVDREDDLPQTLPSVGEKMIFAFKDTVYVTKESEKILGDIFVDDAGNGRVDFSSIAYKMTPGGVNICGDCTSEYFLTKRVINDRDVSELDVTFLLKYDDRSVHPYLSGLMVEGDNPFTYIIALAVHRPNQRQSVFDTTASVQLSDYVRPAAPSR